MSLLGRYHLLFAASALLAIWVPWHLVEVEADASALQLPPLPAANRMPASPPKPDAAMAGRLFYAAVAQPENTATVAEPTVPALPQAPTLVGTALSRRGRAAAILRSSAGATQLVSQGQSVDGWRVTMIADGAVTVTQAGEQQRLTLPRATSPRAPQ